MQEGSRFGPYQLIKRIAYGGMAEIHLAKATGIGGFEKLLALKVIHPKYSEDQEFIDMLIDEAKIAVQLSHVNIAQIFDLGKIDSTYYIAMEFIDGKDLYQLLVKCSELDIDIPFEIIAFLALETAAGLQYAHTKADNYGRALNLIHRDISPQNVLVSYDGEVKIVDFGIAKATHRSRETESGVIKGKFFYMSPEQAWGDDIDARTDIFSTGICLYEMITGEMLYNEEKALVLLDKVRKAEIPPMRRRRPDLPPQLEQVVLRALSRDRQHRYQSAGQLQGALSAFLYSNWPNFHRGMVKDFMRQVFGDQRFVLPMPEPEPEPEPELKVVETPIAKPTQELDALMGVKDFNPAEGHSVIFDLGAAGIEVDDFAEDDRTVAGPFLSQDGYQDDEEERTITEAVWAAAEQTEVEDEDRTAVVDMSAVEQALAAEESLEQPTNFYSRNGEVPAGRLNKPAQPSAGPTVEQPAPIPAPRAAGPAPTVPPTPQRAPNRAAEGGRPTLSSPARAQPALAKVLSPTGITLLALLALLTYAGFTFLPGLLAEEKPVLAALVINSVPQGAKVVLDGTDTGEATPARIEQMQPGASHDIRLEKKGYETHSESITLSPEELRGGGEIKRRIFLKKAKGKLKVKSTPPGAEVFVDGSYVGDTPLTKKDLSRERNEVLLLVKKHGFRETRAVLTWDNETVLTHEVELTKRQN